MIAAGELRTLIRHLREDLAHRRIADGLERLESCRAEIEGLGPGQEDAASLLGCLAQWVDIGFASPELIRTLVERFPRSCRAGLSVRQYLHLRMAEGLVAMNDENFDEAIGHFRFVEALEVEVRETELPAICTFWTGRCLRKQGRYDDALACTMKARTLASERGFPKMAAVMKVMEGWLLFQKGKLREATAVFREAQASLAETDDFVSRGNVASAYGRIARRQGRYEQALEHFAQAIADYKCRDPQHMHLARSLLNIAFVQRLIALRLQTATDEESARRRSGAASRIPVEDLQTRRSTIQNLREEARVHLAEAMEIYRSHGNHRGTGSVYINYGFLNLDDGDLDAAASDAAEAFRHGEEKRDHILLARARTLQCMVENARLEEEIETDASRHAHQALDYAREAVEYARETQNPRLLARACIWEGLTCSSEAVHDHERARRCCDAALALLRPEGQDYVWYDLEALKARILRVTTLSQSLQAWSEGLTGDRTFQQITEEFAAIVIPRVWEREGRKVSRVAERLSISPKKVRRILHAAGLLPGGQASPDTDT